MSNEILKIHGSIFFLLKKYVEKHITNMSWEMLLTEAKPSDYTFDVTKSYPLTDMNAIIDAASKNTGLSAHQLKENFGEFMVPDLFRLYSNYMRPEWKTFDVLENTEKVMHGAVRNLNSSAEPPVLSVNKVHEKLLIIDYYSKRRMGALAVGIIKGIATFYNEHHNIIITPTSNPEDERVQIRVEYK